jgi:hypothetical protein
MYLWFGRSRYELCSEHSRSATSTSLCYVRAAAQEFRGVCFRSKLLRCFCRLLLQGLQWFFHLCRVALHTYTLAHDARVSCGQRQIHRQRLKVKLTPWYTCRAVPFAQRLLSSIGDTSRRCFLWGVSTLFALCWPVLLAQRRTQVVPPILMLSQLSNVTSTTAATYLFL